MKFSRIVMMLFFSVLFISTVTSQSVITKSASTVHIHSACRCIPKTDYRVNVTLHTADVIVLDHNGRHVTDLKPTDFRIWEDGKEQKIDRVEKVNYLTAIKTPSSIQSSVETPEEKPVVVKTTLPQNEVPRFKPRNFIFIFANLPDLPVQMKKVRNQALEFIKKDIAPTDNIAVFKLTRSYIRQLQPFTTDKEKSLETIRKYLVHGVYNVDNNFGEDFLDFHAMQKNQTKKGPFDLDRVIKILNSLKKKERNQIYRNVIKNITLLGQSLRYMEGRKNIILVSSGLHYYADIKEPVMDGGPSSLEETRNPVDSLNSLGSLTVMNRSLNRYNISLYVLDVGKSKIIDVQDSLWDAGATIDQMKERWSDRNYGNREDTRTFAYRTSSASTGGKFFHHAGTSEEKLRETLREINYKTAFHYNISYYPNPEPVPGEYRDIEVEVSRPDVTVIHRKGLTTPPDYLRMSEEEKKADLVKSVFSPLFYNELPLCTDIRFFPLGNDDRSAVLLSMEIPLTEIIKTGDEKPELSLDISCLALTAEDKAADSIHRKLNLAISSDFEKKGINRLRFYHFMNLNPGEYRMRFFIRDRKTGKMASDEQPITVPSFGKNGAAFSSLIPLVMEPNILSVSEYTLNPPPGQDKIDTESPLYLDGNLILHQMRFTVEPYKEVLIFLTAGENGKTMFRKENPQITWEIEMEKGEEKTIPARLLKTVSHADGTVGALFAVGLRDITPGKYIISATTKGKGTDTKLFRSSTTLDIKAR